MRDDLHKSVSLQHSWSAVLRKASRDKYTPDMLAPVIVNAVQQDLGSLKNSSWRALEVLISQPNADLFDDGVAVMRQKLRLMQDGELPVSTRLGCEVALGVLADKGLSSSFYKDVLNAVRAAYASDQLELIVTKVFNAHGCEEAAKVDKQFSISLTCCNFCEPALKNRPGKKTVDQVLSTELELTL